MHLSSLADELDSLKSRGSIRTNEQRQLAGKYANAEELEQAYLNLQQKMGQQSSDEEGEYEEYDEPDGEPSYEYGEDVFGILQEEMDEYGALTEETIATLSEYMDADELVALGMEMVDR